MHRHSNTSIVWLNTVRNITRCPLRYRCSTRDTDHKKHLCCPVKVPLCATCISSHQTPIFTWRCSNWKLEANYYVPIKPPHEVRLSKLQCLTLFSLLEKISSVKILREEQTNQHAQKYMRWAGGLSMLVHTCRQYHRWQGVSSKTQTGARHQKQR
jgi:hypothetical protein